MNTGLFLVRYSYRNFRIAPVTHTSNISVSPLKREIKYQMLLLGKDKKL